MVEFDFWGSDLASQVGHCGGKTADKLDKHLNQICKCYTGFYLLFWIMFMYVLMFSKYMKLIYRYISSNLHNVYCIDCFWIIFLLWKMQTCLCGFVLLGRRRACWPATYLNPRRADEIHPATLETDSHFSPPIKMLCSWMFFFAYQVTMFVTCINMT